MTENKPEQIFVVMTCARQVNGEYVFLRGDGAFRQASRADELVKKLAKDYVDSEGKPKVVKVTTPNGEALCHGEVGAFTLELQ